MMLLTGTVVVDTNTGPAIQKAVGVSTGPAIQKAVGGMFVAGAVVEDADMDMCTNHDFDVYLFDPLTVDLQLVVTLLLTVAMKQNAKKVSFNCI